MTGDTAAGANLARGVDLAAGANLARGVDLAVLEPIEAYALRAILEFEGLRVNWFPVATTGQLQRLLSGTESLAGHLVICCHGDERGIVLEGLAPEADLGEPPPGRLTPEPLYKLHRGVNSHTPKASSPVL